jgi:IS1 family transposase
VLVCYLTLVQQLAILIVTMNVLTSDRQAAILRALCEGSSIRATARMVGCSKDTVQALLKAVGAHCKNYHDRFVRGVSPNRVQADELWSFVGKKDKRATFSDKREGRGDVWTWTALDQDSKLMIAYRVGQRDAKNAEAFMADLKDRLSERIQLTTDGLSLYLRAVEKAFKWNGIDYAMLVKIYGTPLGDERRYSPAECIGAEKHWVMGQPKEADVSTSHVERTNLTVRMQARRYTRLTNAFSKKVEFHLYATALFFMFYNYCRKHETLTRANRGIHTTPAMAVGLTNRVWTVYDLLDLLQGK